MIKPLYDFEVGDEVWDLENPGVFGTVTHHVFDVKYESTMYLGLDILWGNKMKFHDNVDRLRPKTLPKSSQPYSVGAMKHTHTVIKK